MPGLEGTIKTPLGPVQKKTALILGGGVVVLGVIVWYRQKQVADTPVGDGTENPINPATGYPYGSPEDAAALAEQAGYVSPAAPVGGSTTYPTTGYTTNGQWVQAVVEYMVGNGLTEEPTQLSSALGKYIIGAYATDTDVNLIQQAIAVKDFPPISGPNGYPPSINKTPPTTTPPTSTPNIHGRGYGWYKVVKGDNITSVAKKWSITTADFIAYNGADALRVGEWVKVRAAANPSVGYNGRN